ncbi:MAG TPA: hypothetical protein VEB42_01960 [Chitinophagaceae bacterium]|nr:hypothetical protein [Chitinophagaceae bacterium]
MKKLLVSLLLLVLFSCAQRIRVAVVYPDGSTVYKYIGKKRIEIKADTAARGYIIELGGRRM